MTTPSPLTWTLRLKARKTTALLHVDPLETFSSIKSRLYNVLQETELRDPESGERIPLPESPAEIHLGRPVDVHDAQQGFRLGEWELPSPEEDEEMDDAKGKGKAKGPRKSNGTASSATNLKECPKGAGLKDGAVLAFRWAGDGNVDGDDEGNTAGDDAPNMWGVKLASFEDAYGVENEMDVGGGREFEG